MKKNQELEFQDIEKSKPRALDKPGIQSFNLKFKNDNKINNLIGWPYQFINKTTVIPLYESNNFQNESIQSDE